MPSPAQVQRVVKNALIDLGSTSGHHTFEQLCVAMGQRAISPRIVLATGPVAAGGDQGRDAETLWTEAGEGRQIVLPCTTRRKDVSTKIKADVRAICTRGPAVDRVVACVTADIRQDIKRRLKDWARESYSVDLEVWDGANIAAQLAQDELFWIAETYLQVPRMLGPARYRQIADLLEAHLRYIAAARQRPWNNGQVPPTISRHVQRIPVEGAAPVTAAEIPLLSLVGTGAGRSILITGEPGVGKTTAGQLLFEQLATEWQSRHRPGVGDLPDVSYIPIFVRARDLLASATSFSEMLCRSACTVALPTSPVGAQVFAGRVDRARWLVILDGLDEVQDHAYRRSLVELISDHGARHGAYRFVVLARPLAPSELHPLIKAGFLPFGLPRFSRGELDEFAHGWFAHRSGGTYAGADFAEWIRDPDLVELLRVPLFAGLALRIAGGSPQSRLPRNRLELLEAFLSGLQSEHRSGGPASEQVLVVPDELLATLAERALAGDSALLEAALGWYQTHVPARPIAATELLRRLVRSGLLVAVGEDVAFAHQALAEYLAARHRAAAMPKNGSTIPVLVQNLKARERSNVAAYTVVLYRQSHPEFAGRVIRQLLEADDRGERGHGGLRAAAGLILDGIPVDTQLHNWVINQLIDNAVKKRRTAESVDFLDVLSQFGSHPEIIQRFQEIITSPNAGIENQCKASMHLALNGHREFAESELIRLLGATTTSFASIEIVEALTEISDDYDDVARAALQPWIDDAYADPWDLMRIAEWLYASGDLQQATQICWHTLGRPSMRIGHMEWAAALLLQIDRSAANELCERLSGLSRLQVFDKAAIAVVCAEVGASEPAIALAREVLADPDSEMIDEALGRAVQAWITAGPPAGTEILNVIRDGPPSYFADVADDLAKNGLTDEAMLLVNEALRAPDVDTGALLKIGWTTCRYGSADTIADVLRTIEKHPQGGVRTVVDVVSHVWPVVPEPILPKVLNLVVDPAAIPDDVTAAVCVLIVAGSDWAARGVDAFMRRPRTPDPDMVSIAKKLKEEGHDDLTRRMAVHVLSSPTASIVNRNAVIALLCDFGDPADADLVIATVLNNPWLGPKDRLATAAFLNERNFGGSTWPIVYGVLEDPTAEPETVIAALMQLNTADFPLARARLEAALRNLQSEDQLQLRRILAWLSVS